MSQNITADDDAQTEITATISVDKVVQAIQLNHTNGADDRVIAVPQRDGVQASVRRAFRGSERYSNPSQAPVHIKPELMVPKTFRRPPTRADVDKEMLDVPSERSEWDAEDEAVFDDAYEAVIDVWETDVRNMIEGEHSFSGKGVDITLVGVKKCHGGE
jgi:hypothetical protein